MSRYPVFVTAAAVALLTGCGVDPSGSGSPPEGKETSSRAVAVDDMLSHDPAPGEAAAEADDQPRPVMQAQVVLDRLGFTPGVIDGKEGLSTRNALLGFQEANGLAQSGQLDDATRQALARWSNIPATRLVTIPGTFAAGPFAPLPDDPAAQAKLPALGYATLDEKLAERFHTTVDTLLALNGRMPPATASGAPSPPSASGAPSSSAAPVAQFKAGDRIRVPNVGHDRILPGAIQDPAWATTMTSLGVGSDQPKAARIVVSKSKGTLKVYDKADKLVAMFTATMGSRRDPLPLGQWKVVGVSRNPQFHYNPELFWDVPDSRDKELLPPGPNGPVGVAWIDINKPHYGIHGTPAPETIGRAESHGCVRLTNWDVARLAEMVSGETRVLFEA